jgi:hypothetical protein
VHHHEKVGAPTELKVVIGPDTTIAEAKRQLYGEYLLQSLKLDILVEARRHEVFKTTTSLDHFVKLCEAAANDELEDVESVLSKVQAPLELFDEGRKLIAKMAAITYRG